MLLALINDRWYLKQIGIYFFSHTKNLGGIQSKDGAEA